LHYALSGFIIRFPVLLIADIAGGAMNTGEKKRKMAVGVLKRLAI
jgi:hypothetical protein